MKCHYRVEEIKNNKPNNKKIMKKYEIIFADLDGTLIDTISGSNFAKGVWDFKIKFYVLDAIKAMNPDCVCIVSNQGGIEKGYVDEVDFKRKIAFVTQSVREYCGCGCIYRYCHSNDKNNTYRKPNTRMLVDCLTSLNHSFKEAKYEDKQKWAMIGDASGKPWQFSSSDRLTAEHFGIDYYDVDDFSSLMSGVTVENKEINLTDGMSCVPNNPAKQESADIKSEYIPVNDAVEILDDMLDVYFDDDTKELLCLRFKEQLSEKGSKFKITF